MLPTPAEAGIPSAELKTGRQGGIYSLGQRTTIAISFGYKDEFTSPFALD